MFSLATNYTKQIARARTLGPNNATNLDKLAGLFKHAKYPQSRSTTGSSLNNPKSNLPTRIMQRNGVLTSSPAPTPRLSADTLGSTEKAQLPEPTQESKPAQPKPAQPKPTQQKEYFAWIEDTRDPNPTSHRNQINGAQINGAGTHPRADQNKASYKQKPCPDLLPNHKFNSLPGEFGQCIKVFHWAKNFNTSRWLDHKKNSDSHDQKEAPCSFQHWANLKPSGAHIHALIDRSFGPKVDSFYRKKFLNKIETAVVGPLSELDKQADQTPDGLIAVITKKLFGEKLRHPMEQLDNSPKGKKALAHLFNLYHAFGKAGKTLEQGYELLKASRELHLSLQPKDSLPNLPDKGLFPNLKYDASLTPEAFKAAALKAPL